MKYENAKDLLPPQLLRQVQKYAAGKTLYIPSMGHASWGEATGYRRYLAHRNRDIRAAFRQGVSQDALAEQYCLSTDSIRKIIYSKKEETILDYNCSLSCARSYAKEGKLEEWVHAYLLSDGDNEPFSHGLKLYDRYFLGPAPMPLSLFHRCCGPEENMKWRVHPVHFENKVQQMMETAQKDKEMPPLIIHYLFSEKDGQPEFELNEGNDRFEAYQRLGLEETPVIVWITEKEEYQDFMDKYGRYFPDEQRRAAP